MRSIRIVIFAAVILGGTGCMTSYVSQQAGAREQWNPKTKKNENIGPQPAYNALLPLTLPLDIVTSPLQLAGLLIYIKVTGFRG